MILKYKAYKVVALIMAFWMLMVSVGLSVDMHYCLGQLKSVHFFGKAKPCCVKIGHNDVSKDQVSLKSAFNCCDDKYIVMQLETDYSLASSILPSFHNAILFPTETKVNITPTVSHYHLKPYHHYRPPSLEKDETVLFQQFLI